MLTGQEAAMEISCGQQMIEKHETRRTINIEYMDLDSNHDLATSCMHNPVSPVVLIQPVI